VAKMKEYKMNIIAKAKTNNKREQINTQIKAKTEKSK